MDVAMKRSKAFSPSMSPWTNTELLPKNLHCPNEGCMNEKHNAKSFAEQKEWIIYCDYHRCMKGETKLQHTVDSFKSCGPQETATYTGVINKTCAEFIQRRCSSSYSIINNI